MAGCPSHSSNVRGRQRPPRVTGISGLCSPHASRSLARPNRAKNRPEAESRLRENSGTFCARRPSRSHDVCNSAPGRHVPSAATEAKSGVFGDLSIVPASAYGGRPKPAPDPPDVAPDKKNIKPAPRRSRERRRPAAGGRAAPPPPNPRATAGRRRRRCLMHSARGWPPSRSGVPEGSEEGTPQSAASKMPKSTA